MTAVTAPVVVAGDDRFRPREIWRIVKLHSVTPSVFFGVPFIILGGALVITLAIAGLVAAGTGEFSSLQENEGGRYSWAVLSPQWYLVAVGVQAIAYTFSFALGMGSTRRDYWLGTSLMFVLVSAMLAAAIATLVQVEKATDGWFMGARMFDALWYGLDGWHVDFYTTFAFQLFVLFVGAGATSVFMRWRVRGMLVLTTGLIVLVLAAAAFLTFTQSWPEFYGWLGSLGIVGVFTLVLAIAAVFGLGGYVVIRRATPR